MQPTPMPAEQFWSIIARAAEADHHPDAQVEALRTLLRELGKDDIIAFEVAFRRNLNDAYSWDLWGAAYVINGGCSDDGFEYFRRYLVSRGRETYEAALADPDSLAQRSAPWGDWEFEEYYYVAGEVFEEKGGDGDVRDYSDPEAGLGGDGPSGDPFDEESETLARRFPKLWKRYGADHSD